MAVAIWNLINQYFYHHQKTLFFLSTLLGIASLGLSFAFFVEASLLLLAEQKCGYHHYGLCFCYGFVVHGREKGMKKARLEWCIVLSCLLGFVLLCSPLGGRITERSAKQEELNKGGWWMMKNAGGKNSNNENLSLSRWVELFTIGRHAHTPADADERIMEFSVNRC